MRGQRGQLAVGQLTRAAQADAETPGCSIGLPIDLVIAPQMVVLETQQFAPCRRENAFFYGVKVQGSKGEDAEIAVDGPEGDPSKTNLSMVQLDPQIQ